MQFTVTPETADFKLKDGETTVHPSEGEKFTYSLLETHNYRYTATADGYEDESGTYNFKTDGPNKKVELKQVTEISVSGYKTVYTQGEQFDTTGLAKDIQLRALTQARRLPNKQSQFLIKDRLRLLSSKLKKSFSQVMFSMG